MPVLDTNFLIALQAGEEGAVRLLNDLRGERLVVPAIVAVEFLTPYGTRAPKALEELHRAFTVTHTSDEWVLAAARLRQRLRREKRSLRLADFWIAAWAVHEDTAVVTRNVKDFDAMGVATRSW